MRRVDQTARSGSGDTLLHLEIPSSQSNLLRHKRAEKLLATHGKTFHFATRFFPPTYRHAVIILYAFFRTLDDLVDERSESWQLELVMQELKAWREWFINDFSTSAPREPLGTDLALILRERRVPVTLFLDFLDGLVSDLEPKEFQNFQELYHYCYQVAGTVGLAMAHILGGNSEQAMAAAKDLGIAMQLTNILRDVGEDLAAQRIYLPIDDLERFGFSSHGLHQLYQERQGPDERFCALMRYQIKRARYYYVKGLHGVWLLAPDCRLPILLAGRLYQCILTKIEDQQHDVLRERAATNLLTKLREAGIVFLLDHLWGRGETHIVLDMEFSHED